MSKNDFKHNYGLDLSSYEYLGHGCSGKVFLMPDKKVIKLFKRSSECKSEYEILKAAEESKYFPNAYILTDHYMIRDYVGGTCSKKYLKKHGLSEELAVNMINLIVEFERLGFKRLDMRLAHIFIQEDESVMVIDPRLSFTREVPYPYYMIRGLRSLHLNHKFFKILKNYDHNLYKLWKKYSD